MVMQSALICGLFSDFLKIYLMEIIPYCDCGHNPTGRSVGIEKREVHKHFSILLRTSEYLSWIHAFLLQANNVQGVRNACFLENSDPRLEIQNANPGIQILELF